MCTHAYCPIKEGRCISEKPGWEWAEKFGLPEANATQRQFLIEQSARWNAVENPPNPVEESPPAYPPLATQAKSLAVAAKDWARSGFQMVDEIEAERRLAVCRGCDKFDAGSERCRACGCRLRMKIRLKSSKCPLGLWSETT